MLESETLQEQAKHNTKEQFAGSPDLNNELLNAVMDAYEAQQAMSTQVLDSKAKQQALIELLVSDPDFYSTLRGARDAA
jgi:type I restriction enzyme, R subunit